MGWAVQGELFPPSELAQKFTDFIHKYGFVREFTRRKLGVFQLISDGELKASTAGRFQVEG
jgi:hypothetical protein